MILTTKYNSRSSLEEHCQSKAKTKEGLKHFSLKMKGLDLKASQLRAVRESLEGSRVRVMLSWSHPEPSVCPSSLAAWLCGAGHHQVEERRCQVTSQVMDSLTMPRAWDQDHLEEVLHWLGGVALNLRLQPDTEAVCEGSVACVRSSGLLPVRTVTQLASSATSILQRDKHLAWLAITVHGPTSQLTVRGSSLVEVRNSAVTLLVTRNGKWTIKESCSKDFSNCKKSKYN